MAHAVLAFVFPEVGQLEVYPFLEGGRLLVTGDGFFEGVQEGLVFNQNASDGLTAVLVNLVSSLDLAQTITEQPL